MPTISKTEARRKGIPRKTLQTILLNRNKMTLNDAKRWLRDHNFANAYYRTTANEYRFMQTPDIKNAHYYSKKISDDIILVFQQY